MTDLTVPEVNLIFELLGVVPGGTFFWIDYNAWVGGDITSVPIAETIDFSKIKTELDARITTIDGQDGTDNRRARISEILAEYDLISLDTVSVQGGGGGGARGARYSSSGQRRRLRHLLQLQMGVEIRVFGTRGRTTIRDSNRGFGGGGIPVGR